MRSLFVLRFRNVKYHKSCRSKFDSCHVSKRMENKTKRTFQEVASERPVSTRSSYKSANFKENVCFFCDLEDREENLHTARTFQLNENVKYTAIETGNKKIMTKFSEGDMVETEAVYHQKCLVSLYNA